MKRTLSEDAWLASIGKHRGVAIRILDVFEEMLESKGISGFIFALLVPKSYPFFQMSSKPSEFISNIFPI